MDNRTIDEVRRNEDRLINKIELLEKENQELKNQKQEWIDLLNMFKNQQKEFIEYLQNNIESLEFCDNEFILSNHKKEIKAYKEILSKYKEIIGDKE